MLIRQLIRLFAVFAAAGLLLAFGVFAFLTFGVRTSWVGHTDLNVQFEVVDAATAKRIPMATVHVQTDASGFAEDQDAREFAITANAERRAWHLGKNCMCFGSAGPFEDSYAVRLPTWWYRATAQGYEDSAPIFLDTPEHERLVERGTSNASMTLRIEMRRDAAH